MATQESAPTSLDVYEARVRAKDAAIREIELQCNHVECTEAEKVSLLQHQTELAMAYAAQTWSAYMNVVDAYKVSEVERKAREEVREVSPGEFVVGG